MSPSLNNVKYRLRRISKTIIKAAFWTISSPADLLALLGGQISHLRTTLLLSFLDRLFTAYSANIGRLLILYKHRYSMDSLNCSLQNFVPRVSCVRIFQKSLVLPMNFQVTLKCFVLILQRCSSTHY